MSVLFTSATRRFALQCAAALSTLLVLNPASAQDVFPSKPIRLVIPFATGGGADVVTRMIAAEMSKHLNGTAVIIENKGGAAGNLGMDTVARAPKDGYTIAMVAQTAAANPSLYKSIPFDIEKDFAPIGPMVVYHQVLVVNSNSPIKTLADLIAKAKREPGVLSSGTSGVGGSSYFATAQLMKLADIQLKHVAYKGIGPALNDVLGGHLDMLFDILVTSEAHIKSGRLRALGVTSRERQPSLPDVPALSELVPGLTQSGWLALMAPAGTPPDRIRRLTAALSASLQDKTLQERLVKAGYEVARDVTPAALTQQIKRDIAFYRELATAMKIEPQ